MAKIIRTKTEVKGGITAEVCSIDGCGKATKSSGLCSAHYERKRKHGDPLISGTTPGEPLLYLRRAVLGHEGSECLVWPYSRQRQGYGHLHYEGRTALFHRIVCEQTYGHPPSPRHEAAHSCGNGHIGCVNPNHLSWKTPAENAADKIAHGTTARGEANGKSKLTATQVTRIRASAQSMPRREIASQFGITTMTVNDILMGRTWAWLTEKDAA